MPAPLPTPEEATPVLEAGSCRLRPLRVDDAAAWFDVLTDPTLRRLTSWSIGSVEELRALLIDVTVGSRAEHTRRWALERDGHFIGTCGFKARDRSAGSAEVAYELAAPLRGQRIMRTVLDVVLQHGWKRLALRSVNAVVMVDNVASRKLLEGAGFQWVGRLPAFRVCGGRLCDFDQFERMRPDDV